jgi:hypothetical protein
MATAFQCMREVSYLWCGSALLHGKGHGAKTGPHRERGGGDVQIRQRRVLHLCDNALELLARAQLRLAQPHDKVAQAEGPALKGERQARLIRQPRGALACCGLAGLPNTMQVTLQKASALKANI